MWVGVGWDGVAIQSDLLDADDQTCSVQDRWQRQRRRRGSTRTLSTNLKRSLS